MQDLNAMTFEQLIPSKSNYLAKNDVPEEGVVLTVRGFKQEEMDIDGQSEMKIVLYFAEPDYKPMVLNKTNAHLLQQATGAAVAGDAKGKQIVVYNDPSISFGGKITGGLRIRKYSTVQPQAPRKADPFNDTDF